MHKHFHTEKSGETFLLFDIKISSASNACEGKYLWQNIPLPTSIRNSYEKQQLIKIMNIAMVILYFGASHSTHGFFNYVYSFLFHEQPSILFLLFLHFSSQYWACIVLAVISRQPFAFSDSPLWHVNIQHEVLPHMAGTFY